MVESGCRSSIFCCGVAVMNWFFKITYLVLGLVCCTGFSLVATSGSYSVAALGLLTVVASLISEHGLWGIWALAAAIPGLQSTGSIVVAHRLSCSMTCGIFPDQGSIPCLLHLQADSLPLSHQGSPMNWFLQALKITDPDRSFCPVFLLNEQKDRYFPNLAKH